MTPLDVVIVLVLIGTLVAKVVRAGGAGARSVRRHRRALDTLRLITTQRPVPGAAVRGLPAAPRQAHIKILAVAVGQTAEETQVKAKVQFASPVAVRFVLSIAPPNDLWDTAAIRELVDGPAEPEVSDDLELLDDGEALDDGDPTNGGVDIDSIDGALANDVRTDGRETNARQTNACSGHGDQGPADVVRIGVSYVSPVDEVAIYGRPNGDDVGSAPTLANGFVPAHRVRLSAHEAEPPFQRRAAMAIAPGQPPRRHRRSRAAQKIVAATIVAALAAVAVVVGLGRHQTTVAAARLPHAPTTVTPITSRPATAKKKHKARVTRRPFKLIFNAPGEANYRLAGGARVTVKASGPCWVEIRKTDAEGQEVYTATMTAGATESVTAPAWIRIGRPEDLAVSVGGAIVSPPAVAGQPYDLLFD